MTDANIVQTQVTVRRWPAVPSQQFDLGFVSGGGEPAYYVGSAASAEWVAASIDRTLRMMGLTPAVPDSDGRLHHEPTPPVADLVQRAGYHWHQLPDHIQADLISDWESAPDCLSDGDAVMRISSLLAQVAPEASFDSEENLRTRLHEVVRDAEWEDLVFLEECAEQLDVSE